MVEFTLFGVPVRVHFSHWIGLAIIGGIFYLRSADELMNIALFMIAGFISILAHEMGHALVGRKMGGGAAAVTLIFFGGYTQQFNSRFTGHGKALHIAAGPAATIIIGLLAWLAFIIFSGNAIVGSKMLFYSLFSPYWVLDYGQSLPQTQIALLFLIASFAWIGFWWTLLNLLPIMPMDGGQLLGEYMRSQKRLYLIGGITSGIIFLLAVMIQAPILMLLMGYMCFQNFKEMQHAPF